MSMIILNEFRIKGGADFTMGYIVGKLEAVNLLIALAWPSHVHHRQAQEWFARRKKAGFRTCPLTETGFVRISSNPQFTPDAVSPSDALALLGRITSLAGY